MTNILPFLPNLKPKLLPLFECEIINFPEQKPSFSYSYFWFPWMFWGCVRLTIFAGMR